jgi:hypothetical protein
MLERQGVVMGLRMFAVIAVASLSSTLVHAGITVTSRTATFGFSLYQENNPDLPVVPSETVSGFPSTITRTYGQSLTLWGSLGQSGPSVTSIAVLDREAGVTVLATNDQIQTDGNALVSISRAFDVRPEANYGPLAIVSQVATSVAFTVDVPTQIQIDQLNTMRVSSGQGYFDNTYGVLLYNTVTDRQIFLPGQNTAVGVHNLAPGQYAFISFSTAMYAISSGVFQEGSMIVSNRAVLTVIPTPGALALTMLAGIGLVRRRR